MGDQARPLAPAAPADSVVPLPGVLEAVISALAGALTTGGTRPRHRPIPPLTSRCWTWKRQRGFLA
jgi:hypothetical protein